MTIFKNQLISICIYKMIIAGYELYFIEEPLIKLRVYEEYSGENQITNILNLFSLFWSYNLYVYENYGINFMKEDLKKRDLLFKLYESGFSN